MDQIPIPEIMNNEIIKLETKHLDLFYGEKQALKQVQLSFPEKKSTALIGPSGCGKSTLLRCFNRMHDLHQGIRLSGEILLDGENILDKHYPVNELRRRVGMVFQKPNPFPKTIFENVAYGLRINGIPTSEIADRVESAIKRSYLWEEVKNELQKPANKLSGGQQQRLCIARTIALEPDVILMDEPCSALDPISTSKIEELTMELEKTHTVLMVTHNMQQAVRVAKYTAFMYMGELIEYAETSAIFNHPQQKLTKDYVNGNFG
jgi:phosphate transport system ATP-binding protein